MTRNNAVWAVLVYETFEPFAAEDHDMVIGPFGSEDAAIRYAHRINEGTALTAAVHGMYPQRDAHTREEILAWSRRAEETKENA
jgi:hypothetical protein